MRLRQPSEAKEAAARELAEVVTMMTTQACAVTAPEIVEEVTMRELNHLLTYGVLTPLGCIKRLLAAGQRLGLFQVVERRGGRPYYGPASMDVRPMMRASKGHATVEPTQQLVLSALAAAESVHLGPVTVREITAFIPDKERSRLKRAQPSQVLSQSVSGIVTRLVDIGLVASFDLAGERRYARSMAGSHGEGVVSDEPVRRARVLALALATWREVQRPFRLRDVLGQGWPDGATAGVAAIVAHALSSLAGTGDLIAVDRVRGGGREGSTLYVPKGHGDAAAPRREPLSDFEVVAEAFAKVWKAEVVRASSEHSLPRPVSTNQVRRQLEADLPTHRVLADPSTFGVLMAKLASEGKPLVRAAKSGESHHAFLWVPVEVPDAAIEREFAFATETDKVIEAARRALRRTKSPTITQADVAVEFKDDERLAPHVRDAAHCLYYISTEVIAWGRNVRRPRVKQRVVRIGNVGQINHYTVRLPDDDDQSWQARLTEARAYVAVMRLQRVVDNQCLERELGDINENPPTAIAVGRLRAVAAEAHNMLKQLAAIPDTDAGEPMRRVLERRVTDLHSAAVARECKVAAQFKSVIPADVVLENCGWTAAEFLQKWVRYDSSKEWMKPSDAVRQLNSELRRIPNPDFVATKYGGRMGAAYLYETVASKLYLARRYGGRECMLHAVLVSQSLGRLRDVRYMVVDAVDPRRDVRLQGIVALGWHGSAAAVQALAERWHHEHDASLRAAILWACAVNNYPLWREYALGELRNDNPRLRMMAASLLEVGADPWLT